MTAWLPVRGCSPADRFCDEIDDDFDEDEEDDEDLEEGEGEDDEGEGDEETETWQVFAASGSALKLAPFA